MRIDDVARKFTVFFGTPDANESSKIIWRGTGFLVLYREDGSTFPYLVTARHVAERAYPGSGIVVRVNKKDGKTSVPMTLAPQASWFYHPDPTVDVAVTPRI